MVAEPRAAAPSVPAVHLHAETMAGSRALPKPPVGALGAPGSSRLWVAGLRSGSCPPLVRGSQDLSLETLRLGGGGSSGVRGTDPLPSPEQELCSLLSSPCPSIPTRSLQRPVHHVVPPSTVTEDYLRSFRPYHTTEDLRMSSLPPLGLDPAAAAAAAYYHPSYLAPHPFPHPAFR